MPVFTSIAISIGAAFGFGASSFFVAATAFALKTLVGLGVNMLISKLMAPDEVSYGIQGKVNAGDTVSRSILLGFRATMGSLVWMNTWGSIDETPNTYFTSVIALSDIPIASLEGGFFGGERVTFDTDNVHPNFGIPIEEYRINGADHLWLKFYDGTQTVADPMLTGMASTDDRPYENTRVGKGIAYVIVTARINDTLFTGFPVGMYELNGMKLYDISKDSTQGGDGPQRKTDPSTWGGDGDHLLAVQLYNILSGIYYDDKWLYGLQQMQTYSLPAAWWIAQVEKCRQTYQDAMGTIYPQFRTSIEIPVKNPTAETIEALLLGANGRLTESGGIYKLYVGAPDDPVASISDDVILSTYEQSFVPFYGLSDSITGIEASYPEPKEAWNSKTAPAIHRADLEASVGNRRLPASVAIDTVPYPEQVQRVMLSSLREAERARRHTIVLPPRYWVLEPGDTITWTSVRNGYENKLFRIDGVQDLANVDVMVDITEIDPSDYDWDVDTDYVPPIIGIIGPVRPAPQPVSGWQVFPGAIRDAGGIPRRPSIEVHFAGNLVDIEFANVKVRLAATQQIVFDGNIPYGNPATNPATIEVVLNGVFLPLTEYEVQGLFVPYSDRQTTPTLWLPVTTDNIKLGIDDIWPEELINDLIDDLGPMIDWVGPDLRKLIEDAEKLVASFSDLVGTEYKDRKQIRESINSTYGAAKAYADFSIDVATGPDSAIAQSLLSLGAALDDKADSSVVLLLQAQVTTIDGKVTANSNAVLALESGYGDITANANLRFGTTAGPAGYGARIGLEARTGGAGAYRIASFFIDVPTDALQPTRIVLLAQQVAVMTSAGTVAALFDGDTTYLNNARIINLKAANIDVNELTSSTGFFDNLVITSSLQLGPGVVVEGTIAAHAITSSDSDQVAGANPPAGGAWVAIVGITISSPSGNPIRLYSQGSITGGTSGSDSVGIRLLVDGVAVAGRSFTATGGGATASLVGEFRLVTAGVGSVTNITIEARSSAANGYASATLIGECNKK